MELNSKALQEAVQLNLDLVKANNQISRIKELISQMLKDKCDLSVSFKMHNETRCEENKAAQQGNPDFVFFDGLIKQLGAGISGHPVYQYANIHRGGPEPQEPCKNTLDFEITDTNGVRILSILLAEKEEAKRLMIDRLNQLINPVNISFRDDPNPIASRYSQE
jgi:hypothetical protein